MGKQYLYEGKKIGVRESNGMYIVSYMPRGGQLIKRELLPCATEEHMQSTLDAYAQATNLCVAESPDQLRLYHDDAV
jgi:hypothetical protein